MYLVKTHRFPKIAWKPIIVYKELMQINCSFCTKFETPYQNKDITLNKPIKNKINILMGIFSNIIEGEGVHAYTKFKKALATVIKDNSLIWNSKNVFVICKCIVPRFSLYYLDYNGEIASNKLIPIEIVNES